MKKLPWKQFNKRLEKAISSNTFSSMEEVEDFIIYSYTRGISLEVIKEEILKFNFKFLTMGIDWLSIITNVIRHFKDAAYIEGNWENVNIYADELEVLQGISDLTIQQILYILLVIYKWNNHPSGWVNFPRMACFDFWDKGFLTNKEKEAVIRECTQRGVELRVVGNKNPIICFKINWNKEAGKVAFAISKEEEIVPCFYKEIRNE